MKLFQLFAAFAALKVSNVRGSQDFICELKGTKPSTMSEAAHPNHSGRQIKKTASSAKTVRSKKPIRTYSTTNSVSKGSSRQASSSKRFNARQASSSKRFAAAPSSGFGPAAPSAKAISTSAALKTHASNESKSEVCEKKKDIVVAIPSVSLVVVYFIYIYIYLILGTC